MPFAAPRQCTWPGCAQLVAGGRCEQHRKQERREYDKDRQSDEFRGFYATPEWRSVRAQHLAEEPLCRECRRSGIRKGAEMVDHITPIRRGGEKFDPLNLQSLCHSCHSAKSIREGSRYGCCAQGFRA
jgi:5-methylcytosine-specific restriction protein A